MGLYMDKRMVVIVKGIILHENKVLILKRSDSDKINPDKWEFVGGKINFNENLEDALKREFKEELNIDIKVGKFLGISENIFNYKGKNAHELVLFYDAYIDDKDYQEKYSVIDDDSETEAMWIDINDLKIKS